MQDIRSISIVGAGTMGNGIAHLFALNNFKVALIDISDDYLQKGIGQIRTNLDRQVNKGIISEEQKTRTLNNIVPYTDLKEGVALADFVVEAATENEPVKLKIFTDLDKFCKPEAVLASNTSSISITRIASVTKRPEKVIGMHFMNPVPVMPLVEVINGYATDKSTTMGTLKLAGQLGKTPVEVNDYPGFVANRILMPMLNEAIICLQEGVAGVKEIDTVMKLGMSHPMGPLELADFIGLDVCLSIMRVLYEGLGNTKYAPSPLLVNMVEAGRKGIKTGEGFYSYTPGSKEKKVAPRFS